MDQLWAFLVNDYQEKCGNTELPYPTWGKGASATQKCLEKGDVYMFVPRRVLERWIDHDL